MFIVKFAEFILAANATANGYAFQCGRVYVVWHVRVEWSLHTCHLSLTRRCGVSLLTSSRNGMSGWIPKIFGATSLPGNSTLYEWCEPKKKTKTTRNFVASANRACRKRSRSLLAIHCVCLILNCCLGKILCWLSGWCTKSECSASSPTPILARSLLIMLLSLSFVSTVLQSWARIIKVDGK